MIIVQLEGGLGNQLYEYALGRHLAHRHNTELKLDITNCEVHKNSDHAYYRLGEFNIQENFATAEESARAAANNKIEKYFNGTPKDIDTDDDIFICGHYLIDDAGNDSRENLYLGLIKQDNFIHLKLNRSPGKAAAYNKGLDLARGEYVLFLTGKDIIFPDTMDLVYQTFGKDIIYSVRILEENINGDFAVQNISDKKFSVKVDETFKNLNSAIDIKISPMQKLLALASEQINNSFANKIFRHEFLSKNKIRFTDIFRGDTIPCRKFLEDRQYCFHAKYF